MNANERKMKAMIIAILYSNSNVTPQWWDSVTETWLDYHKLHEENFEVVAMEILDLIQKNKGE